MEGGVPCICQRCPDDASGCCRILSSHHFRPLTLTLLAVSSTGGARRVRLARSSSNLSSDSNVSLYERWSILRTSAVARRTRRVTTVTDPCVLSTADPHPRRFIPHRGRGEGSSLARSSSNLPSEQRKKSPIGDFFVGGEGEI